MDKKILFLIFSGILLLPVSALAQMEGYGQGVYGSHYVINMANLIHNVEMLVGLFFGAIAVVMFVVAGILFLTAQGDPQKVSTARMAFIWGVAGVIVGLVAFSIIAIVASVLGP